jgi:putative ABC transport system permease protein
MKKKEGEARMIGYDLKTAWRQLRRHKGYTLINLTGLTVGLTACLLLFLFVRYEMSYDRFLPDAERIFRVIQRDEADGEVDTFCGTPAPLGPALKREFPEVEEAVRLAVNRSKIIVRGRRFQERIFAADPAVFEMFDLALLRGDAGTALDDPSNLLLSESAAARLFSDADPAGRVVSLDGRRDYRVAGVFRDMPANSHLRIDFLRSFAPIHERRREQWGISNYYTYIRLSSRAAVAGLAAKMPGFIDHHRGLDARRIHKFEWLFQPLTSIHLRSHWRGEVAAGTRPGTLYIFSAVALFMLLIACFNAINLAVARYTNRAPEVGLRRVIGASRARLVRQFLGESFLLTLLALPTTLLAAELALPAFNAATGRALRLAPFENPDILLFAAGMLLLTGILSGLYPALLISRLQPARVFQRAFTDGLRISLFRKGMVIFQFALSLAFIIGSFVVASQLRFLQNRDLGYSREHVVMLPINESGMLERREAVKSEFLRDARILSVSATSFFPGENINRQSFRYEGMPDEGYAMIRWITVDEDFARTLRIPMAAGRDFSAGHADAEGGGILLNRSAARELGWTPEEAMGKRFELGNPGRVVGVFEDFNFQSLHQPLDGLALAIYPEFFKYFAVRLGGGDVPGALAHLRRVWDRFAAEQPFEYIFLDDQYNNLYRAESRLGRVFAVVTGLSILIACLGLFGLAAFAVERRTREIGIRKVLGASRERLVWLLSRDFAVWALLANLAAWPVAYVAMRRWLENFAFRTALHPWPFLAAAALLLGIVLATVGLRTGRAAARDPVEILRWE